MQKTSMTFAGGEVQNSRSVFTNHSKERTFSYCPDFSTFRSILNVIQLPIG